MATDLDPIKQLQSLLEDRGKVLEKSSRIHSALGSARTDSAAQGPESPPGTEPQPQTTANPFSEQSLYGRSLHALREMQAQIEERVRPLAQMVAECEVTRLREQADQHQAALQSCLAEIDRCLLKCVEQLGQYRNKHASLLMLNERIAQLGGTPEPLPDPLSPEDFHNTLQARVEDLRQQRKL